MAAFPRTVLIIVAIVLTALAVLHPVQSQLSDVFYAQTCPKALETVKSVVERSVSRNPKAGSWLLRLHFHDCFVNGCDGSVLLDDTGSMVGEKTAPPNMNSLRGFEIVDEIKAEVDRACGSSVVSCADILAVAARDAIVKLGGQSYKVELGRRDTRTANKETANTLPSPQFSLQDLINSFGIRGLSTKDLVVLSGAHTIGSARCVFVKQRLNDVGEMDLAFADRLRNACPAPGWSDNTIVTLDETADGFDNSYYKDLINGRGLLHSDQQLLRMNGGETDQLVRLYARDQYAFWKDFGESMINMGRVQVLTGNDGEIRRDCRRINY